MKKTTTGIFLLLILFCIPANGQLTPQEAIKGMKRGLNIGNTMDPTSGEGTWGNPAIKKRAFADYKNAGFTAVRIPITWDKYVSKTSPYTVTKSWMDRVDTVVKWGLEQKLIIIINMHHEHWLKQKAVNYTPANIARFDSIWSQIATHFKDHSDSLLFEMVNEPEGLSVSQVIELNKRTLATIRKTNPTRIVLFSGHEWANSEQLLQTEVPDTADKYLMAYYHSYDPYPFGLEGPGSYGTESDINTTRAKFESVANWSKAKGIPVILGEYSYSKKCEYNSRMTAFATVVDLALEYGIAPFIWDDGGDYPMYNRLNFTFNEIKDILIYTYKESPNKMAINLYKDTLIQIRWKNRTTLNDSIVVERKTGTGNFAFYKKIGPSDSSFIDSTINVGKTYYYRLKSNIKDSIEFQSQSIMIKDSITPQGTYLNKKNTVPGTLEAENFDVGLSGQAYKDNDPENKGNVYRFSEGVDISKSTGSVFYLTHLEEGEWVEYTLNVTKSGSFKMGTFVGAESTGGEFSIQFDNGTPLLFKVTSAGEDTKLEDTIQLTAGSHVMKVNILKPGFTINKYTFTQLTSTSVESSKINELSIYPNPANDKIQIVGIEENSTIDVYNVNGALILRQEISKHENTVETGTLSEGLYILKITNSKGTKSQNFLKK